MNWGVDSYCVAADTRERENNYFWNTFYDTRAREGQLRMEMVQRLVGVIV